jgi:hypothetical protein
MSLVAVHILGSQCVLQLATFYELRIVKSNNSLLPVVILIKMRSCSRVLHVVNDGWRVRCLHWVAVVLVGFFAFSRSGKCWTSFILEGPVLWRAIFTYLWMFVVLEGCV